MGFYFRRRIPLRKGTWLNVSKRGVSGSQRVGPLTFNSRGRTSIRLGRGIAYRGGCASVLVLVGILVGIVALAVDRVV